MAIDYIHAKDPKSKIYAAFGEIMLRLAAPNFERFFQSPLFQATFGGGESNVLASLAFQGCQARFLSALPENALGSAAKRVLQGYGVDVSHVLMKKNSRMGIYFIEKGANQRPSKVIYDREESAINAILPGEIIWEQALNQCGWFHITGISPALSKPCADISLEAVKMASDLNCIVSCDLNYRAKLWNYGVNAQEIMSKIVPYVDVIIANEEDCQKSLGIGTDIHPEKGEINEDQYKMLASEVLKQYPNVKVIAITLRESISASHNRWSACISDGKAIHFSRKYDITDIVDRVGGGDSFSAGLIYGLSNLSSIKEAVDYATAASCLTHSIEGDVNLSTAAEIMNLYQGDASGRIKR
jgi:2-dehydro-3-deoxygluconokinase